MDEISFRLGARFNSNAFNPPHPQPQMAAAMMDASLEAQWWAERLVAAGFAVVVVSASFGGLGATHILLHACPNRGGGVIFRWQWRRQRKREVDVR